MEIKWTADRKGRPQRRRRKGGWSLGGEKWQFTGPGRKLNKSLRESHAQNTSSRTRPSYSDRRNKKLGSVRPSVCLSVSQSGSQSVCQSARPAICLPVCPSLGLSVWPPVRQPVSTSVHQSVCQFVNRPVRLAVRLWRKLKLNRLLQLIM